MIKEYVEFTELTAANLASSELDNLHMVLGMVTEVGELADVFKKNMAYGKEIDWVNVKEELGDLMFYVGSFCRINSIDLEKVMETNMNKLKARYPDRFDRDKALNRDLENERQILEV